MTQSISQPGIAPYHREGIFCDIPAEAYHYAPGVSQSMLKRMRPTPAHLLGYLQSTHKPTPAMKLGTLVHARVLEPSSPLSLAVKPEGMKFSTKEGKAWRAEQQAQGLTIITAAEAETLEGCVESLARHPRCREIFACGSAELSVFKNFNLGGTALRKARIDWVPTNGNALVDVKTCEDASPSRFAEEILSRGYHRQAAYYLDIWNDANANDASDMRQCFVFIAVEKTPPYAVAVYDLEPRAMAQGRRLNVEDLQTYIRCIQTGEWPGYPDSITTIDLPARVYRSQPIV